MFARFRKPKKKKHPAVEAIEFVASVPALIVESIFLSIFD